MRGAGVEVAAAVEEGVVEEITPVAERRGMHKVVADKAIAAVVEEEMEEAAGDEVEGPQQRRQRREILLRLLLTLVHPALLKRVPRQHPKTTGRKTEGCQ